jgi:hypothetical protein
MNEYASDLSMEWAEKQSRIDRFGQLMGNVLGHLDEGQHQAISSEWQDRADYESSWIEAGGKISGYAIGEAVSKVPGGVLRQACSSTK